MAFESGTVILVDVSSGHSNFINTFRVYAARGRKQDGQFALDSAIEALDYLEKHFEIEFPMAKIDMTAVPDYAQVNNLWPIEFEQFKNFSFRVPWKTGV